VDRGSELIVLASLVSIDVTDRSVFVALVMVSAGVSLPVGAVLSVRSGARSAIGGSRLRGASCGRRNVDSEFCFGGRLGRWLRWGARRRRSTWNVREMWTVSFLGRLVAESR